MNDSSIYTINMDMLTTIGVATLLLVLGHSIKNFIPILKRFFIPAPVIGGIIFSFITLIGYKTQSFAFTYDDKIKDILMLAFFTSIGFMASFKMLIKGGIAVAIFLVCSIILICVQNGIGIGLAKFFDLNPLIGLASGSVSLSGGHGTSAAFGPELESHGLEAGLAVSIASATFGLVVGSIIGGPLGHFLLARHKIAYSESENQAYFEQNKNDCSDTNIDETTLFKASVSLLVSMFFGYFLIQFLKKYGIILPAYLGPMIVACIIRNATDYLGKSIPLHSIDVIGRLSLNFFLAIALMTMRLWELEDLAIPLITILLIQTLVMALFAYFVTFRMMGKDYDAAVIACGQCGFGMGATPNAMANMNTFTGANGPSPKAFFVVPMVGALFIDFVNAIVITGFIKILS